MEIKMKHAIDGSLQEEFLGDKLKLKQGFERLERDLKQEMEKHIQAYFRTQSETYKEQIKSGVMQEHLIHKDMINNKLEKLFKASEEKRRRTQVLFARHLSGLNFFVDNAQKQLGILREVINNIFKDYNFDFCFYYLLLILKAYKDMLKNKDLIDYYGDEPPLLSSSQEEKSPSGLSFKDEVQAKLDASLSSLSLATLGLSGLISKQGSKEKSDSKDNLYAIDDEALLDENLLQDIS